MSSPERRFLLAIAAAFALACASTPEAVERARANLREAEADPAIKNGAAIELQQARKAVERLEDAADDDVSEDELDHLAYLADQKIEIARTAASEDEIRQQVKELTEKREELRQRARGTRAQRTNTHVEEKVEIRSERVK